jgi:hypothetical protein
MSDLRPTHPKLVLIGLCLVLLIGIFLRLPPSAFERNGPLRFAAPLHPVQKWYTLQWVGIDEELYRGYVDELSQKGITHYPDIILHYIEKQVTLPGSILPPVRFLYIFAAYIWHTLFGSAPMDALKDVASFFSILTLGLAALIGWRLRGPAWSLGLAALIAFAPTQVHMSQHALVDGFFTFWAMLTIWLLWENLQAPGRWPWLIGYVVSLCLLTLTKENAFFVWIAIVAVLFANRWFGYGTVTAELLFATVIGPLLGVVTLVLLAGGFDVLYGTYRLLIIKNYRLPYAIKTGDGPWYRYLVDLMLVSPLVLILAFAALFRINFRQKTEWFFVIFIAASYLVMCNVKYGMNLRYANMWDIPLHFLALSGLVNLTALARGRPAVILGFGVAALCLIEFRQYLILFVNFPLYELVSEGLLRALHILK